MKGGLKYLTPEEEHYAIELMNKAELYIADHEAKKESDKGLYKK